MGLFYRCISILIFILGLTIGTLHAQEFNAQVSVNSEQIQRAERQVFQTLETTLFEFINNTKWTDLTFAMEERIECNFVLVLDKMITNTAFSGKLQIQYARPAYNSSYLSTIINHQDIDVSFNYIENDRFEYNDNTANPNLVSIIAFYAYVILGLDADSYALGEGSVHYANALKIANFMQSGGQHSGWRDGEGMGQRNRYWIAENLNNPINEPFFKTLYDYHRLGLDLMYDKGKHKEAKEKIMASIIDLQAVHRQRPTSILLQMFLNAKRQEIISIFSDGEPINIVPLKEALEILDPTNRDKYEGMGR